ncbi:hypothetical protein MINS_37800 [Mycolicibacterium insubricum]|uniref:Uncharacterized protein n=1 Tax=Mycolicibacterium insubricum TaxID=444597 RepID=A0A1X0DP37_9MYCO|nr:hypothetical protein [Mycolicibacterium insubricum]MCV7083588.1 hypothetical protein [Mycolicibacterium insubricum]ORA73620.1 hypothetical protein BST26_02310 [Mycolicibacterium insubricum]BBZ68351.1 hypothetical protein MINS_37800 [Mycolicibacterium insubricum]
MVGGEIHDDHDQFSRVESGKTKVVMGPGKDDFTFEETVGDDDLKLYSLYGPAEHLPDTRHETFPDADADPQETDLA